MMMRTCLLLAVILLALPALAGNLPDYQWQQVNPLLPSLPTYDFALAPGDTIFAAGDGGIILRSIDGAETWQTQNSGCEGWLLGADFTDRFNGWIVGEEDLIGIVLHTTDGGENWQRHALTGNTPWLECVDFIDSQTGVIVGWQGTILWTTDGGQTWDDQSGVTDQRLMSVHMFDAQTAIAVGLSGTILRTTNGGASWATIPSGTTERLHDVEFFADLVGLIAGWGGTILRTLDGGLTWESCATGSSALLETVVCRLDGVAMACGGAGLLISDDYGATWEPLGFLEGASWRAGTFYGAGGLLLAEGPGNIWRSDPAFIIWSNSQTSLTDTLLGLDIVSSQVAVAVGNGGAIVRTEDEGQTWYQVPHDMLGNRLRAVSFADSLTGLATGDYGLVLRTEDGGLSWTELPNDLDDSFYDVACLTPQIAVAVGSHNSIQRTVDGGLTWQQVGEYNQYDYHQAVHFTDELYGWTCTFYGRVFHTQDGGLTWQLQHTSYLDLQDIHFSDRLHGISVGGVDGNATLLTDDGGASWTQVPNAGGVYLSGVLLIDPLHAVTVGQGVFHTDDGAATWQEDPVLDSYYHHVCMFDSGVALIVGGGGLILRSEAADLSPALDVPQPTALLRAYPNPFNPQTNIVFRVPRAGHVTVQVFDVRGRLVTELVDGQLPAGGHEVPWRGVTASGRAAPSGVYLARMFLDGEPVGNVARVSLIK